MKLLVALTLLLLSITSFGQDYLLTTRGDTLRGELKLIGIGNERRFVIKSGSEKKSLPFMQVKGYQLKGVPYKLIKGPDGYTFMKPMKTGYLSLYSFQLKDQLTFDGLYLSKLDGTGIEVPNLSFKRTIRDYLKDCAEIVTKLDSGEYTKKNLVEIVEHYNRWIKENSVDHTKNIQEQQKASKRLDVWLVLEEKIQAETFQEKTDVMDVIREIKNKINSGQKVPKYMLDAVKGYLGSRFGPEVTAAVAMEEGR